MKKAEHELSIFRRFASAANFNVDYSSLRQDPPPGPDIVCQIDNSQIAFELTGATNQANDEDVKSQTNRLAKKYTLHDVLAQRPVATAWIGTGHDQSGDVVAPNEVVLAFRKKLNKTYNFDGPIELVIHEGLANLAFKNTWIHEFVDEAQMKVTRSPFRRIWVVSHDGSKVFAVWPPKDFGATA